MHPQDQAHNEVCGCIFCTSIFFPCLTPLIVATVSVENYCTMKKFEEWRQLQVNQQGVAMQPIQPVAAVPAALQPLTAGHGVNARLGERPGERLLS